MSTRRYRLDSSSRRAGDGQVLIAGSPLKLLRLTAAGSRLIDRIADGEPIATPQPGAATAALLDRLLDAGIIHPEPSTESTPARDITIVIPAHDAAAVSLQRLVDDCRAGGDVTVCVTAVIVVDDASTAPIGPVRGAQVVRRVSNGGPGAARQTGLALVTTPFVAFVDTDVQLPRGWLAPLAAHFDDDAVALVAPRVRSTPGTGRLARFEALRSPLDLGPEPARVRAGTRVSYVPSAVIVCRADAIRAVGGFDPTMRIGEDVDLVWRLDEAGFRLRYEPAVTANHEPRPTMRGWLRQRFDYGTSAAALANRHPGDLAPVRVSGWSASAWFATLAGWPVTGGLIAAVTTGLLAGKLRDVPNGPREAIRLAGLGHLFAGRSLASAVTRAWCPIATMAAVLSRRCRRVVLVAAFAPPIIDWLSERPPLDAPTYVALRLLDDAAYGTGVTAGAIRNRSAEALRPDFTSWPKTPKRPKARRRVRPGSARPSPSAG